MPWSKMSGVPKRLRTLLGAKLTLAQVNWMARIADGIPEGQVRSPWAVARSKFKKAYVKKNGRWVKREKKGEEKSLSKWDWMFEDGLLFITNNNGETWSVPDLDFAGLARVTKEADHYRIEAVSTAAVKDLEEETFGIEAIDYDLKQAKELGDYPEVRMFHKPFLRIGKIDNMKRVGIFAVDSGYSYTDPFSIAVCEKMLANNDGTWRVSRGFRVVEASGTCPRCNSGLLFHNKHMVLGFRCPTCKETYLGYKRRLDDVRFRKARTFDVTVTDVPAVPYTAVMAFSNVENKENDMTKDELREKLIEAGVPEKEVDSRLSDVTDEQLKEFDDLPAAVLLKEFDSDDTDEDDGGDVVVLDKSALKAISDVVSKTVQETLDGVTIEIPNMDVELKELPELVALREEVEELKEMVSLLLEKDETRLKELLEDAPRGAKLRIMRFKDSKKKKGKDNPDDEDEDEEDEEGLPPWLQKKKETGAVIVGGDGRTYSSMTDMVMGGE